MFLLTPAVDPRYQLGLFPANLKQKVVRLLKPEVDIHSCRETGQSGQVSLVPPNKLNYLKLIIPKFFFVLFTIKSETSAKTHASDQQDSVDQEIET